ncbi:hypothetical protein Syun_010807 [Stephania yunnanensis]|uniref:VQ domain-containing protein n=1 Tax=Stephania yunnanensis TaxID=152371 RepID=A0AAP0PPZ4_9MAGN
MAMSDTMSGGSSPSSTDWAQLYNLNNLAGSSAAAPQHDATVVATATATTSGKAPAALSPEGRVSKPARRRRASRAAPTTLLNTDTTNFRAMVQQFTGVPSAAFAFGSTATRHGQVFGPNLSFGLAPQQQQQLMNDVGVGPHHQQISGYSNYISNNRYQQQQQQQRFYNQQQQQQQQYVFPLSSGGGEHIVGFGMSDAATTTTSTRANNNMDGYNVMDHGHDHDNHDHHHHHHVFRRHGS